MRVIFLACVLMLAACGSDGSGDADGGTAADAETGCEDGARRCSDGALQECTDGAFETLEECADSCDPTLGCVVCQPGGGRCEDGVSRVCKEDGSGFEEVFCDPVQGMSCDANSGRCIGVCSPSELGRSYIGCEYFPTVTGQAVSNTFEFAVVIANSSDEAAAVTIDGGPLDAARTFTVPSDSLRVETLPWQQSLKLCNGTQSGACPEPSLLGVLAPDGAFHLRSNQPVTVYQFSPLDATDDTETFTLTNDASLLLPANALTGDYVAAAWPYWADFSYPGLVAITGVRDGTEVTVTTTADITGGGDAPDFTAGTPGTVTLDRGDVLELPNASGDLTGSIVEADGPVQVIGGHYCTNVPFEVLACDHLEESIFPVQTLSKEYVVTAPAVPPIPDGKERFIRVVATASDTTLTIEPEIAGVDTSLDAPGDFVEIARQTGDYAISADEKVLVVQYMEGQDAGGDTGDPAMTLAVATDQYRTGYLFHAPTNYDVNYVNIVAPTGATVMLDDQSVTDFTAIGSTGFGVARVELTDTGNHTATSTEPFGISVYGYGQRTSYWYPGGLDLANIPVE